MRPGILSVNFNFCLMCIVISLTLSFFSFGNVVAQTEDEIVNRGGMFVWGQKDTSGSPSAPLPAPTHGICNGLITPVLAEAAQEVEQSISDERGDQAVDQQSIAARYFFAVVERSETTQTFFDHMLTNDRTLYAKLQNSEGFSFADAYLEKLTEIRDRFAQRDQGVVVDEISLQATDVATLLLLGSLAELPAIDNTHQRVSTELYRAEIGAVLEREPVVEKLFNAWVLTLEDDIAAWRALRRAHDLQLTQVLPAAEKFASTNASSASLRSMAIVLIGRIGSREQFPILVGALDDKRLPRDDNTGSMDPMQVRDLAVATLIVMSGEQLNAHGMILKPAQQRLYIDYGFENNASRTNTIRVWRERIEAS